MIAKFPIVLIALGAAIFAGLYMIGKEHSGYDLPALYIANIVMLVLSLLAWKMKQASVNERPQAFVRGVYGATMLRLFVCIAGFLTYVLINRGHLHKPTLMVMGGIYLTYMIIETLVFSSKAKKIQ